MAFDRSVEEFDTIAPGQYRSRVDGFIMFGRPDQSLKDCLADAVAAADQVVASTERRLVAKHVIVDRLQSAGLLDAAYAALDAQDRYTRERWNTRTHIYADDPTAVALLKAIGADPEVILAP
jgi:hypothetical protein